MNRFRRIYLLCFLLCLFLSVPASTSGQLQSRDYDLIRVAFMNGCIITFNELKDEKKLQELKNDEEALKAFVQSLAAQYMAELDALNRRRR